VPALGSWEERGGPFHYAELAWLQAQMRVLQGQMAGATGNGQVAGEEIARYPQVSVQPFVTPLSGQELAVGSREGELWLLALEGPASASLGLSASS